MVKRGLLLSVRVVSVGVVLLLALPSPDDALGVTVDRTTRTQHTSPVVASVSVTNPVMVVNSDGSATLSAALTAVRNVEVTLESVQVRSSGADLDVLTSRMLLPVVPGHSAHVGDASDAGGYVVPHGIAPGDRVQLKYLFDDGSCVAVETTAVNRTQEHSDVYPKTGSRLDRPAPTDRLAEGRCRHRDLAGPHQFNP